MEFAELEAFVAVVEHGSFSAAAQDMGLTQPAVSKRIAALEARLSSRLFDRIGKGIGLTEAGRALLPRARRVLQELEDTRRTLSNLSGVVRGQLRVGTSHHIGLHRLPPVLRAYTTRYPEVDLDLRFLGSEAACQAVERGELELAIVTLPMHGLEGLVRSPLWPDPLAYVVARGHVLAREPQPLLAELERHPAILPERGTFTRELAERALEPFGVVPQVRLSTNFLETIKMLVAVGLGWSVLPRTMLDPELHVLPFAEPVLGRRLGIVRHVERTLSNAARALIEVCHEHALPE